MVRLEPEISLRLRDNLLMHLKFYFNLLCVSIVTMHLVKQFARWLLLLMVVKVKTTWHITVV